MVRIKDNFGMDLAVLSMDVALCITRKLAHAIYRDFFQL